MTYMFRKFAACVAMLMLAGTAQAALVTNGDFDNGFTGWSITGANNFITGSGNVGFALVLNDLPGIVPTASQNIAGLATGSKYTVSWDARTVFNCCNSSTTPGVGVSIDGHQFDFIVSNHQSWVHYSFDFTYAAINSLLVLSSQRNGTDSDAVFDNVAIDLVPTAPTGNQVPEPGSLALTGLALALIAARSRLASSTTSPRASPIRLVE